MQLFGTSPKVNIRHRGWDLFQSPGHPWACSPLNHSEQDVFASEGISFLEKRKCNFRGTLVLESQKLVPPVGSLDA